MERNGGKEIGRSIPFSDSEELSSAQNQSSRGALSSKDIAAVTSIRQELKASGILRDVETMRGIETEEDLTLILKEAEDRSLSEAELNPDYHNARLDEILMGMDGGSNPLMEKFEDYEGLDYNPAFRARDKFFSAKRGSKTARKRRTL